MAFSRTSLLFSTSGAATKSVSPTVDTAVASRVSRGIETNISLAEFFTTQGTSNFPPASPTPTPPTPASPTATASDLQVMISAIPIAEDGHIITADYHNALRLALVAIANRLGIGPVDDEITISNAPRLSPVAGAAAWDSDYGFVQKKPATATATAGASGNVRGWMEMELPDGARIKKMMVFGTTSGTGTLKVKLKRQKITDPTIVTDLIAIEIPDAADGSKGIEGDVTVPGTGAGAVAIEEYRIINNREQKYLVTVELDNIDKDTSAQFSAVQIVCGQ